MIVIVFSGLEGEDTLKEVQEHAGKTFTFTIVRRFEGMEEILEGPGQVVTTRLFIRVDRKSVVERV